ncbi:MAG: hypothetical protein GY938_07405, partial [Ketobacter sp.]|nr:hypothetical protein [Ketobacter sp.]
AITHVNPVYTPQPSPSQMVAQSVVTNPTSSTIGNKTPAQTPSNGISIGAKYRAQHITQITTDPNSTEKNGNRSNHPHQPQKTMQDGWGFGTGSGTPRPGAGREAALALIASYRDPNGSGPPPSEEDDDDDQAEDRPIAPVAEIRLNPATANNHIIRAFDPETAEKNRYERWRKIWNKYNTHTDNTIGNYSYCLQGYSKKIDEREMVRKAS